MTKFTYIIKMNLSSCDDFTSYSESHKNMSDLTNLTTDFRETSSEINVKMTPTPYGAIDSALSLTNSEVEL